MNKNTLYQFVERKKLLLTFFVLFSLFISENVFAKKKWTRDYLLVTWNPQNDWINISAIVYDYLFDPSKVTEFQRHGYLSLCRIEAAAKNKKYYKLMDIVTEGGQLNFFITNVNFKNNTKGAKIQFLNLASISSDQKIWTDNSRIIVSVPTIENRAVVSFRWHLEGEHLEVQYIRISLRWNSDSGYSSKEFKNIVYVKPTSSHSVLD